MTITCQVCDYDQNQNDSRFCEACGSELLRDLQPNTMLPPEPKTEVRSMKSWSCDGVPKDGKDYPSSSPHEPYENFGPDCVLCGLPQEAMAAPRTIIRKKRNRWDFSLGIWLLLKIILKKVKKIIKFITKILKSRHCKKTKYIFPFTRNLAKYKFTVTLKPIFRFAHEPVNIKSSLPFIGRQAELDALVERILFSNGGSFLVTGYRGVGKSSFVNQVVRNLEAALPWAEKYLGKTEIITVQLNLARPLQPSELMHHIIRRLYEKILEKNILSALSPDLQEQLFLAYRRTSFNMVRSTSKGWEHNFGINELSLESGKLKASFKPSLGYQKTKTENYQASFLGYDDKAAEYDVIEISRRLASGYLTLPR